MCECACHGSVTVRDVRLPGDNRWRLFSEILSPTPLSFYAYACPSSHYAAAAAARDFARSLFVAGADDEVASCVERLFIDRSHVRFTDSLCGCVLHSFPLLSSPAAPLELNTRCSLLHFVHHQPCSSPFFWAPSFNRGATISNKWTNNFDERLHRRLITDPGCKWIRPILTASNTWFLGSTGVSCPKRHLDRFSRFCRAHERNQRTDRQTY